MDKDSFDAVARVIGARSSRRQAAAALVAVAAGGAATFPADAKKKKRCKNKCDGFCIDRTYVCCNDGSGYCYPGEKCCPRSPGEPNGFCLFNPRDTCCRDSYCEAGETCCPAVPSDPGMAWCIDPTREACCPASLGGGACRQGDKCCPPRAGSTNGYCVPSDQSCDADLSDLEARGLIDFKSAPQTKNADAKRSRRRSYTPAL